MSTKCTLISDYFSVLSAKSTALGVNTFRQVKCCSTTLHWCKYTGIWRINRGVFTVAIQVLLIELKLVSLFYRKMAGRLNISQNSRWHVSQSWSGFLFFWYGDKNLCPYHFLKDIIDNPNQATWYAFQLLEPGGRINTVLKTQLVCNQFLTLQKFDLTHVLFYF